MSTWGKAIVLAVALVATLVAPAHAGNQISVSAAEVTLAPGQNTASVGVSWHTDGNQPVQIWIRESGKAIGTTGLNYLRHKPSDVRLHSATTSVRITVRAESSTQLQVDALTAAVR